MQKTINGAQYIIQPTANLSGADLRWADLRGADLIGADLRWAVGNGKEIKSMQIAQYAITWTNETLAIGCKQFPIKAWLAMSADEIATLDIQAAEFYQKYADLIKQAIKLP